MPFELCELRVREFSAVRSRLDYVFRGVFLIGDFLRIDMTGDLMLPDDTANTSAAASGRFTSSEGAGYATTCCPSLKPFLIPTPRRMCGLRKFCLKICSAVFSNSANIFRNQTGPRKLTRPSSTVKFISPLLKTRICWNPPCFKTRSVSTSCNNFITTSVC